MSVHIKTLCTRCQQPLDCNWPTEMTFAGQPCTAEEYMAKTLTTENVGVYCDDCLDKMPDVKLEDLRYA
jgi:hypothetical protein